MKKITPELYLKWPGAKVPFNLSLGVLVKQTQANQISIHSHKLQKSVIVGGGGYVFL